MNKLCSHLFAQYQELDDLVAPLSEKEWELKTPFDHWTIFDQVAHIAFFDHEALEAIDAPTRFKERASKVMDFIRSGENWPEHFNPILGPQTPGELLSLWRDTRTDLLNRLEMMGPKDRLAWYGPDLGARSFATARLMETWAHGQDIFDTLGKKRVNYARLKHVAHMGVNTFGWSFKIRGMKAPELTPFVKLSGPCGEQWAWGDPAQADRVWGSAADFCLVVTQRRNLADTRLECRGKDARRWLTMAQAFAGVPQEPPAPGLRNIEY
ncbi:MAG: TIGR03084 family protein [Proteobacteria bacterium]|nr:TIGR03084 family protein [Pseudomonadota bacterium]